MKQTIEIEVPDGYKAVYDKDTQKVEIVRIELPKSWEEFCENNPIKNWECFITERSKIEDFYTEDSVTIPEEKRARNVDTDKSTLPDRETAEAFIALMQLIQLRDCYRQGWKPDWKNNENKFVIEIIDGEITTYWDNRRSRTLSFQSIEVRDKFFENFSDLIEKAKKHRELTIVVSAKIDKYGRVKIMQDVNTNYPNISLVREVRDRTELILSYLDRSIEEFINNRKDEEDDNETDKV